MPFTSLASSFSTGAGLGFTLGTAFTLLTATLGFTFAFGLEKQREILWRRSVLL